MTSDDDLLEAVKKFVDAAGGDDQAIDKLFDGLMDGTLEPLMDMSSTRNDSAWQSEQSDSERYQDTIDIKTGSLIEIAEQFVRVLNREGSKAQSMMAIALASKDTMTMAKATLLGSICSLTAPHAQNTAVVAKAGHEICKRLDEISDTLSVIRDALINRQA